MQKTKDTKEAFQILKQLEKLLDERITDLHEVKGGMQARHAYIYYRKLVWEALTLLE